MEIKDLFREVNYPIRLKDDNGNLIYEEFVCGLWTKYERDQKNRIVYIENSSGKCTYFEYDEKDILIYLQCSDGFGFDFRPKKRST